MAAEDVISLVDNPNAGSTFSPELRKTFASFGGALMFDGSVEHVGLGNRSTQICYFLYSAIYTGQDSDCE